MSEQGQQIDVEAPVFVEGIGPPLRQIREDYEYIASRPAQDILALIDAYLALQAELEAAREREQDQADIARGALEERDAWRRRAKHHEEREKGLREALESIVALTVIQRKPGTQAAREIAAHALAASPPNEPT